MLLEQTHDTYVCTFLCMHVSGTNIWICMLARFWHKHIMYGCTFWEQTYIWMYASTQQVHEYRSVEHIHSHNHVKCLANTFNCLAFIYRCLRASFLPCTLSYMLACVFYFTCLLLFSFYLLHIRVGNIYLVRAVRHAHAYVRSCRFS